MSNVASTSGFRPDFRPINDSLYEFYAPPDKKLRMVEVIFFHGLHLGMPKDAFWKTWTSGNECWPQTWLAQQLPLARVLSVAYDASVNQSNKNRGLDLFNIAENLVQDVICSPCLGVSNCPIILVAHSLGGLVVKQLIIRAKHEMHEASPTDHRYERLRTFLENVRGIFYFSTPHVGADISNFTNCFSHKSPVTSYLSTLSTEGARLNEEFRKWRQQQNHNVLAYAVLESEETRVGLYSGLVVSEASARHDVDSFRKGEGDHFTVCAPQSPGTASALHLLMSLIKTAGCGGQGDVRPENFQFLPERIVGIDLVVLAVCFALIDNPEKFATLGIYGMGGIGKTTIAKAVFNTVSGQYEYTCFIDQVKDIQGGVAELKNVVLKNVHRHGKKINSEYERLTSLRGTRLFLVLDDVDSRNDYLEDLLSNLKAILNIDEGSRFLVTCRDAEIVKRLDYYLEVPLLHKIPSRELFVGLAKPHASLQRYVDHVVEKCDGLPLTLVILGKHLGNKSEAIWKEAIQALDMADGYHDFDERLWAKLKVSFNALKKESQEMFLDAATILYKRPLSEAMEYWSITTKETHHSKWQHLIDMSLVWEQGGRFFEATIGMHDQLRSLGKNIASTFGENGKCSRLSLDTSAEAHTNAKDLELFPTGNRCDEIEDIRALRLSTSHDPNTMGWLKEWLPRHMIASTGINFKEVVLEERAIHMLAMRLDPDSITRGLCFAELKIGSINISKVPKKDLGMLVLLVLWNEWMMAMEMERKAELYSGEFDSSVLYLPVLNILFEKLVNMNEVDDIQQLSFRFEDLKQELQELQLGGWDEGLRALVEMLMNNNKLGEGGGGPWSGALGGFMSILRMVGMSRSGGQSSSSEDDSIRNWISGMKKLRYLCVQNVNFECPWDKGPPFPSTLEYLKCTDVIEVPFSPADFDNLKRLAYIQLSGGAFQTLPRQFGQLSALRRLDLKSVNALRSLPESFGKLRSLRHLHINAPSLAGLPESFGQLSQLEQVTLDNCIKLENLPQSFGGLSKLTHLNFFQCGLLTLSQDFGKLSQLQSLEIFSCFSLQTLPDTFGHLPTIEKLEIKQCPKLRRLPNTFNKLATLRILLLERCNALSIMTNEIGSLSGLKKLTINGCHLSHILPEVLQQLAGLEDLVLRDPSLDSILESKESLQSLKTLKLQWSSAAHVTFHADLPGWLGNVITPRNIRRPTGWTFNIKDGKLHLDDNLEDGVELARRAWESHARVQRKKAHKKMMRKVNSKEHDYGGLLSRFVVYLDPFSPDKCFYLQERGILRRLNGDLAGALEDLTEVLQEEDDYECRKHRGYVRFLMKDLEGAREDGQRAMVIKPDRVDKPDYGFKVSEDGSRQLSCLGEQSIEYLALKLL